MPSNKGVGIPVDMHAVIYYMHLVWYPYSFLEYSVFAGHYGVQVAHHYHVAHGADFNFKWKLELESPFPLASLCTNQNSESWILLTTLS